MKKNIIPAGAIALLLIASSCGSKGGSINAAAREAEIADSIAQAEQEQQRQDSIREVEIRTLYANAITIEADKLVKTASMTCEGYDVKLPCTVTNNTPITIDASEYSLSCTETISVCSDGSEPDIQQENTTKSKNLEPGESAKVSFVGNCVENLSNPKVKLNISEENFVSRVKEKDAKAQASN